MGFVEFGYVTAFGLIAKPLYEPLQGRDNKPLDWTGECDKAFWIIREKLLAALVLGLLDIKKPFDLFVHE